MTVHTVDGRKPAPFETPWNIDSPANANDNGVSPRFKVVQDCSSTAFVSSKNRLLRVPEPGVYALPVRNLSEYYA